MELSNERTNESFCVPETILKRIFDLINQVREEYQKSPLQFSKELSFIAGEHACNMSTKMKEYGHDGFDERSIQVPTVTCFSENIAALKDEIDPGQAIVVYWLKRSMCFTRLLGRFTHTGIGVAESEDGTWFCTQIFATYKEKVTTKDYLLLTLRLMNRYRYNNSLPYFSPSLPGTKRLISGLRDNSDFLSMIPPHKIKSLFVGSNDAEVIQGTTPSSSDSYFVFIQNTIANINNSSIVKGDYNEFSYAQLVFKEKTIHILGFAKCSSPYPRVPKYHEKYSISWKFLYILNDYRVAHGKVPLVLSHQWCHAANSHCKRMLNPQNEIEIRSLEKRIGKFLNGTEFRCAFFIIPKVHEPIRELFLMCISSLKTKAGLLSDFTHFAFSYIFIKERYCMATMIIGNKKDAEILPSMKPAPTTFRYMSMTSDENEGEAVFDYELQTPDS